MYKNGALYVAVSMNHAIRKIEDGAVTTLAGNGVANDTTGRFSETTFDTPEFIVSGGTFKGRSTAKNTPCANK